MVSKSRTSNRRYKKNRARVYATQDVCWICGQWVDQTLPWPHPYSRSGDHVIPLARGGHIAGELKLAHLICNQRRYKAKPTPTPHGRNW